MTAPPTTSGMAPQVFRGAVDHDVGCCSSLIGCCRYGDAKRVIDRENRSRLVSQVGDGGDVHDLQQRIGRCLDPDHFCFRGDDLAETIGAWIVGVASNQAPRLEDTFQDAEGAAVKVRGGGDFIAGLELGEHRVGGGETGRERQAALAAFEGGEAGFQGGARRVAAARIFVALVLAGSGLRVGRSGVDRHHRGAGRRVGVLPGVNRVG